MIDDSIEQDKINQEENKLDAGNRSGARFSKIQTTEQDNKTEAKRSAVIGLHNDVQRQGEDIDRLNKSMEYVANSTQEIKGVLNQLTEVVNRLSSSQDGVSPGVAGRNSMGAVSDILNSPLGEKLLAKLLPDDHPPQQNFIDQNYINDQVKNSVMGNFDIGNALVNNLKSKLIGKAVSQSVQESLKDVGHNINEHGPG